MTFQVFSSFILRPTYIVSLLGASNPDATLIFSVLFGGAVFSFLIAGIACYVYCTWLAAAVFEAVANGRGGERWFRHGIRWLSISIAIVSTLCLVLLTDNRQALAFDESEPIIAFFKHFPSNDLSAVSRARVASINEDRLVRAEYPKREKFEAKNVVLIISDALRADHMGVYGYRRSTTPFLSTLLSNGLLHRVDMTLSSCSETYCGVTTTFASRPFYKVSPYNFGIHNLLHDMGFRINFFLSGYHELPRNLKYMRQSDVDMLFYPYSLALKGPSDDKNLLTALEEAPSYNGQPNFFYFHLMSTHAAGAKSPKFEEFKPASWLPYLEDVMYSRRKGRKLDDKFAVNPLNSEDQRSLVNWYDNGVLQSDNYISKIFNLLEEKGYLKNCVVVITGDHGDGLGEHSHVNHSHYLFQEDIRIPLLFYDRDIRVYRNGGFATQIDIAPTIVDRMGLPIPTSWDGVSLLRAEQPRSTLHQTSFSKDKCYAVVEKTDHSLRKYLRCNPNTPWDEEALFDLIADPEEKHDTAKMTSPEELTGYRSKIEKLIDSSAP